MTLENYHSLKSQGWALNLPCENVEPQRYCVGDLVFEFPDNYSPDEVELEVNGIWESYKIHHVFAHSQFRSAMVIIRYFVEHGTADLGARMYREINRDVITPLSKRVDVKNLLAKQSAHSLDSEPKTE